MKLRTSSVRTTVRPQLKVTALRKSDLKKVGGAAARGTQCGASIHCGTCSYNNFGKTWTDKCGQCQHRLDGNDGYTSGYGGY